MGASNSNSSEPDFEYYKGTLDTIPYYYWSGSSNNRDNNWNKSTLNTQILNNMYLDLLGNSWENLISKVTWKVGGITAEQKNTMPKNVYDYEVGNNSNNTTYSTKIGLMYVSDYGYASSPENWNLTLDNYNIAENRNSNWLFMGAQEWTITRNSNQSGVNDLAFFIRETGNIDNVNMSFNLNLAVRPTFYLNSDVTYVSGTGTQTDPYRIA